MSEHLMGWLLVALMIISAIKAITGVAKDG